MTAAIHLVIGSTGAGKSTYARTLAAERGAVRFAIDEWMAALFFPERPEDAGFDWYMPRIERCTEVIWDVASQVVGAGSSVVLEIGLTGRAERAAFYARVDGAGLPLRLHVVDAPVDVRWQRVDERNRARGETFSLEVTRGMFDFVEGMWEPPDADELTRRDGVVVTT